MLHRSLVLYLAAVMLLFAVTAFAETDLNITGQVRVRHEIDSRQFREDSTTQEYADMRTRLQLSATVDGNAHAVVQFQDSRRFGGLVNNQETSGTLNNTQNVDIHQAYLQIDHLWTNGPGLKLGRFEFNMGNQRVFGAVGWHNVGRAWEGWQGWYDNPQIKVTGYWLKRLERGDQRNNQDVDIFGANTTIKHHALDIFAFYERDGDHVVHQESGSPDWLLKQDRFNIGIYHKRRWEQFDLEINGVYQFGTRRLTADTTLGELDIAAFLLTFEAGYYIPGSAKARVAAGIDYASGEENRSHDKLKTYDNLYYTGHKFRGYMDYFLGSATAGLIDLMLRGKISPAPGWLLKGDLHYFKTAADYTDFTGEKTTDVGTELDLSVSTKKVAGVDLAAGTSIFLPTEAYAGMRDPKLGFWSYTMATVDF